MTISSSLKEAIENQIFIVDDYTLIDVSCGKIECSNSVIIDVYHVPSLSVNLLPMPHLTQTSKKVEFSAYQYVVKALHNNFIVSIEGFLDPKNRLYNFCDHPKKDLKLTILIAQTND